MSMPGLVLFLYAQEHPVLAHPIQYLFLDQLSVQRSYPFLAETGVAEPGVEVLLWEIK